LLRSDQVRARDTPHRQQQMQEDMPKQRTTGTPGAPAWGAKTVLTAAILFGLFACAAPPPPPEPAAAAPAPAPQIVNLPQPETPPAAQPSERDCLAEAIYFEGRSEPRDARIAIAHVVLNRAADEKHAGHACEVIREGEANGRGKCQFSWRCDGLADKPREMEAWAEAQTLAAEVLEGKHKDPTNGALWFHHTRIADPPWAAKLRRTAQLGEHVFYAR